MPRAVRRPEEKDEEVLVDRMPKKARPFVDRLTQQLLAFADTTVQEAGARRYFLARGVEYAVIFVDHGRAMADVLAPRPGGTSGTQAHGLRARVHAGAHREGWVLVPLEADEDVRAAVELARMGYEDVLGEAPSPAVRKERPLESFAAAAQAGERKGAARRDKPGKAAVKRGRGG
jgi:hypothetical protein